MKVSKYWKAVVAAGAAGSGALSTALVDERITAAEWWTAAIAVVTAGAATWGVRNAPNSGEDTHA